MALTKYKIGDLIEQITEVNSESIYGPNDVRGMTINKEIIPTKADVEGTDLRKFCVIHPREFIFNPRTHGKRIGFGYNNTQDTFIISWNNIGFKVKDNMKVIVLPEYLFLHFNRREWDREACYRSWGSSTEVFTWDALCEMILDLPSVEVQQKYVDIYNAMLENQKNYERGLEDLKLVCDGYIEDLRRRTPVESIGAYIAEVNLRNSNLQISNIQGVNSTGNFGEAKANTTYLDFRNYKIVQEGQFAYNPSRINLGSVALLTGEDCVVSPMYVVFEVINRKKILPEYLMMWLGRKEFQRSTLFYATGSVRDIFSFDLMQEVAIPIPSIKIQQAIVNIYNQYKMRKEINEKLKVQIKNICPILIRGATEEA